VLAAIAPKLDGGIRIDYPCQIRDKPTKKEGSTSHLSTIASSTPFALWRFDLAR
jgi:hypothetical protein